MPLLDAALARYGNGMVFGALLLDALGFPLPGELALLAAGYWASVGRLDLPQVIAWGSLGAALGDNLLFLLGRKVGRGHEERYVGLYCRWTACALGSADCVGRTRRLIGRLRARALLVAKFALVFRTFVAPIAGLSRIRYRDFAVCEALGALLWCVTFALLGNLLGGQREVIERLVHRFNLVAGLLVASGAGLAVGLKVYRRVRYGAPAGPSPPDGSKAGPLSVCMDDGGAGHGSAATDPVGGGA